MFSYISVEEAQKLNLEAEKISGYIGQEDQRLRETEKQGGHRDGYSSMSPAEVRALIREGKITGPTAGMCAGYAQANLVILPKDLAYDFLLFTQRNPKSCPLLEVSDVGGKGLFLSWQECGHLQRHSKISGYMKMEN